jgi:hypothetical protein
MKPDLEIPKYEEGLVKGWSFNIYRLLSSAFPHNFIYKTCSTGSSHGEGWDKTNCQKGIKQYSTKEKAAEGLKLALSEYMEEKQKLIDKELTRIES